MVSVREDTYSVDTSTTKCMRNNFNISGHNKVSQHLIRNATVSVNEYRFLITNFHSYLLRSNSGLILTRDCRLFSNLDNSVLNWTNENRNCNWTVKSVRIYSGRLHLHRWVAFFIFPISVIIQLINIWVVFQLLTEVKFIV